MNTGTLIWLFPIVFMIHDFEEIIMLPAWIRKNRTELERRWPRLAPLALAATAGLSTPAFALTVMILFVFISITTWLAAEYRLYTLWGGMLVFFTFHFVIHIGTWIILRRYVPVIITSLLSLPYCAASLWQALVVLKVPWSDVLLATLPLIALFGLVFSAALALARRFDCWLKANSSPSL